MGVNTPFADNTAITACYAIGSVSGSVGVGGLVGTHIYYGHHHSLLLGYSDIRSDRQCRWERADYGADEDDVDLSECRLGR